MVDAQRLRSMTGGLSKTSWAHELPPDQATEQFRSALVAVVVHELAHVADFGIDQSEPTEKALADAESQRGFASGFGGVPTRRPTRRSRATVRDLFARPCTCDGA